MSRVQNSRPFNAIKQKVFAKGRLWSDAAVNIDPPEQESVCRSIKEAAFAGFQCRAFRHDPHVTVGCAGNIFAWALLPSKAFNGHSETENPSEDPVKNTHIGAIHPLVAGAAASVMLVSLLGAAALTGVLPISRGANAPIATASPLTTAASVSATPPPHVATMSAEPAGGSRTVVHHRYVTHVQQVPVAQRTPPKPQAYSQPAAPQPQYHPVGIGVGAVVGGLLGNQVGGGNGRTLATTAGAVGGGYVGNEVAKRQAQ